MCILILFKGGFAVFTEGGWDANSFVSHYLDIPLVLAAYAVWKFANKTKIAPLREIPVEEALEQAELHPAQPEPRSKGWVRILSWIWD